MHTNNSLKHGIIESVYTIYLLLPRTLLLYVLI